MMMYQTCFTFGSELPDGFVTLVTASADGVIETIPSRATPTKAIAVVAREEFLAVDEVNLIGLRNFFMVLAN